MAPMLLNFQCNDMERLRAPGHHTNISKKGSWEAGKPKQALKGKLGGRSGL